MEEPKIIELDETNTCKICTNALAKYTCPRCNILYCSLTCYQSIKHIQCTEQFYHESVMTELSAQDKDPAMKKKMLDILHKVHASSDNEIAMDSDDDDDTPDLSDRLANVDLNDVKTIWSLLTPDERQEFESLVVSGDVTKLIPPWNPWWTLHVEPKLVQELKISAEHPEYTKSCPKLMENIKLFETITKVKPSECVKYNVLNVLASYTCAVRYFNGDHFDFSHEAVYLLMSLSKNLQANVNFESYSLALESVHQQALVNEWMCADSEVKSRIYKDVEDVLEGPEKTKKNHYLKCAFSDLHNLFKQSKKLTKTTSQTSEFSKKFKDITLPNEKQIPKDKLTICLHKIEYYLSYVSAYVIDVY